MRRRLRRRQLPLKRARQHKPLLCPRRSHLLGRGLHCQGRSSAHPTRHPTRHPRRRPRRPRAAPRRPPAAAGDGDAAVAAVVATADRMHDLSQLCHPKLRTQYLGESVRPRTGGAVFTPNCARALVMSMGQLYNCAGHRLEDCKIHIQLFLHSPQRGLNAQGRPARGAGIDEVKLKDVVRLVPGT